MRVNFYATLRPLAGGKTITVEITAPTRAQVVLQTASQTHAELDAEIWDSHRTLRDHIKVFINGRHSVHLPAGLDTLVGEQDELDVFPPVGGGAA